MSRQDPECAQDPLEVAKASLFKCSNRLSQLAQRPPAALGTWWGPRREAPTGCVTFAFGDVAFLGPGAGTKLHISSPSIVSRLPDSTTSTLLASNSSLP